jgi:hypothetical protein
MTKDFKKFMQHRKQSIKELKSEIKQLKLDKAKLRSCIRKMNLDIMVKIALYSKSPLKRTYNKNIAKMLEQIKRIYES